MDLHKWDCNGFWCIAILVLVGTSGCTSRPYLAKELNYEGGSMALKNETTESINKKIVEGKTTREEVRKMLGIPSHIEREAFEIWNYVWSKQVGSLPFHQAQALGIKTDSANKTLKVVFNLDGNNTSVVRRFLYTEFGISK